MWVRGLRGGGFCKGKGRGMGVEEGIGRKGGRDGGRKGQGAARGWWGLCENLCFWGLVKTVWSWCREP